eukprot:403377011
MDLYIQQSEKQSNTKIDLLRTYGLTLGDVINLNRLAIQAAEMSTQNFSTDVKIGASVMTINGNMYQGSNVESNSNYGNGVSAEDAAIYKAINEGQTLFKAICVNVKHLIKDEESIISEPSQHLTMVKTPLSLNHLNSGGTNGNYMSNTNSSGPQLLNSPCLISPRLNLQLQQSEIFQLPELQRSSTPNGSQLQELYKITKQPSASTLQQQTKRYKSVFQMPNGNWRNNMLTSKNFNMLLISCKSESNFIIKTSQSMMINCPLPFIDHRFITKESMKQMMLPDEKIYREIQMAASFYNLVDFNEETRHQIEKLLVYDKKNKLKRLFGKRLKFKQDGIISKKYYGGYNRINYVTMQLIGHGIAEYLFEKHDRNDLANQGVVIGFDARYESFGLSNMLAAVLKAYQIRVFCLDRYALAPFVSYFSKKFKCVLGIMVTGRDMPKKYSGLMIFNQEGSLIDKDTSDQIERTINDYIITQKYLNDLSPLFDYTAKKVKFKPDNFTDVTMKSYIQELEEQYLYNQRKTNKICEKIVFSSLHGPAYDYMKKILANFGFPSPVMHESHQNMSHNFDTVIKPSVSLEKLILRYQLQCLEKADTNGAGAYSICTDPIGESIILTENLSNTQLKLEQNNLKDQSTIVNSTRKSKFHIFKPFELAIILMEFMISHQESLQSQNGNTITEYVVIYQNKSDLGKLQEYCESRNIKMILYNEFKKLQETQKILLKVDLEKAQFGFSTTQHPDALIASILISQLIVQLQCENKSLYYDYLLPLIEKQNYSIKEDTLVLSIASQKSTNFKEVLSEMHNFYSKIESVSVLNQDKSSNSIRMENLESKGMNKQISRLNFKLISKAFEANIEQQNIDQGSSQNRLEINFNFSIINSQCCLVNTSCITAQQNQNSSQGNPFNTKKLTFQIIKAAFGEIDCEKIERKDSIKAEPIQHSHISGMQNQSNHNNLNNQNASQTLYSNINKPKHMPLIVVL